MDLTVDQLLRVAFDAVESDPGSLPAGLEARVLARSLDGPKALRHPAWRSGGDAEVDSLGAYIRTAAELADLLDALDVDDWTRQTRVEEATVRDVVVHLLGVERYVLGQLGRRPRFDAPRREDHWPVSKQAAEPAPLPGASLAAAWWAAALDVVAACGELGPAHEVAYHHLGGPTSGLLLVRTFELWTHGDDIRSATDRPLSLLDEARLSLMVSELMTVLPLGLALSGCPQPGRSARLKLTGAGGGTFDVALAPGEQPGEPDVTLTAEVIGICRLAANRLLADDLAVVVEGDASLVEPILVGATAFAAD
jgi:uncharacterized protein (TIGR03083 family)